MEQVIYKLELAIKDFKVFYKQAVLQNHRNRDEFLHLLSDMEGCLEELQRLSISKDKPTPSWAELGTMIKDLGKK